MSPRSTAWGAYKHIAEAIRARIVGGEFATGAALPSEAMLRAEYGVARNTLRRALDQLAADGLVMVRPGVGRVVSTSDDRRSGTAPRYRRIADDLREMIESGRLGPGDSLPSEAEVSERYGVARGTVRHAFAKLEGAGLIESVHGKGRFVRLP